VPAGADLHAMIRRPKTVKAPVKTVKTVKT